MLSRWTVLVLGACSLVGNFISGLVFLSLKLIGEGPIDNPPRWLIAWLVIGMLITACGAVIGIGTSILKDNS
jgi:hypothetical protein